MMYLGKQAVGANSIGNVIQKEIIIDSSEQGFSANVFIYMGTIGKNGDFIELPAEHTVGEFYKIISSGLYAGKQCIEGDYIFCTSNGTINNDADWSIIKNNNYSFNLNEDVLEINYIQGGVNE